MILRSHSYSISAIFLCLSCHRICFSSLALSETSDHQESTLSDLNFLNAVITSPEGDESMLSEAGSLSVSIQVFGWTYGVMMVHVNASLVAETTEGHVTNIHDPPQEFSYELFGPQAFNMYTTQVSFYNRHGGEVCAYYESIDDLK